MSNIGAILFSKVCRACSDNISMEIQTAATQTNADLLFSSTTPTAANMEFISGQALSRGIDAYSSGDYRRAAREFKLAISFEPYSYNALDAFQYLGVALESDGDVRGAMRAYREAIALFPTESGFNVSLGNLLFSEGKHEEALQQYNDAIKKNPADSEIHYALGQAYLTLEKFDQAEEQFQRVIQMSPKETAGYYALGQAYRQQGKFKEAEMQLEKALAIEQDFANAHYELGLLYAETKQIDRANEELEFLAANAGRGSDFYSNLDFTIDEHTAPRFIAAYSAQLNLASGPGTRVSTLDNSLKTPGESKNYTISFAFDKEMDTTSVQNISNWDISRSTSTSTGGLYNWGFKTSSTEIDLSARPVNVIYDSKTLSAKVSFKVTQNASGNGTVDLSHLVFKFQGKDIYGNSMDPSADQYNRLSLVV